jgi:hypothetical protein
MLQSIRTVYGRLSNRLIAVLVLMLALPVGGWALYYFFSLNTGSVTFTSDLSSPFQVQINANALSIIDRSCTRECTIENIPAGSYTYLLTTPGRRDISGSLKTARAQPVTISIQWEYNASIAAEAIPSSSRTGSGFVYTDWVTPSMAGYSTGSLSLGYFITIDASGLYTLVDTNSREGIALRLPNDASPLILVKPIRNTRSLILRTRDQTYTYSKESGAVEPLAYYTDIEQDQYGRMIALLPAKNRDVQTLFSLKEEGDLLLDITTPGAIRVLQSGLSWVEYIVSSGDIFELHLVDGTTKSLTWQR